MGNILINPNFQITDSNGDPVVGGKAYFYLTGTTTAHDTYQDSALTTPHANPVIADSTGAFPPIYLDTSVTYKVVTKDSSDVTIRTYDPLSITTGTTGPAGIDGGIKYSFSTTTSMADPGSGTLRYNDATPSSVTAIAIDDTCAESGNPDISAFINSWDDSTNTTKGTLIVQERGAPENFHIYTITGLTDNAGWSELAVTYVSGNGTFANSDTLSLTFTMAGGADGNSAGLYYAFSTTTTMADPGSGIMRYNNATPASVTAIAIDDTTSDTGNPDVSAFIVSWDDSTNTDKGTLIIREVGSPENIHVYRVTGLTDNSGWTELSVAYVAGSGSFADTDRVSVEFSRAGDKGADYFYSVADYGAGNNRAALQGAIDAANAAGGGVVWVPQGTVTVTPHASGYGILLKDGVEILGESRAGSNIVFSGTFTDSEIRSVSRDDNAPATYERVAMRRLTLKNSGSANIALIDAAGFRHSRFSELSLHGSGMANGTRAIRLSDLNPASTSNKSCFYNSFEDIGDDQGQGFGKWLEWEQTAGNCNVHTFKNVHGTARHAFDLTAATNDINGIFLNGWFSGDSDADSWVVLNGAYGSKTLFQNITYEGYTNVPGETDDISIFGAFGTTNILSRFPGLHVTERGKLDLHGYGPVTAGDLFLDSQAVVRGHNVSPNNDLEVQQVNSTTVKVMGGIGFNKFRVSGLGQNATGLTVTNTGSGHTEYVVINQDRTADLTLRAEIKTSPAATDMVLAEVTVDAAGSITAITDKRPLMHVKPLYAVSDDNAVDTPALRAYANNLTAWTGLSYAGILATGNIDLFPGGAASAKARVDTAGALAQGGTTPNTPVKVADRTALKALATANFKLAYLAEGGREGLFEFKSGDYSSQVAADTAEGIYVKADAVASTSGAWVRTGVSQTKGPWHITWFGAVFDGSTDDVTAFAGVISLAPSDRETHVLLPAGISRFASTLHHAKPVKFIGGGRGEISTNANGSASPGTTIRWNGADAGLMVFMCAQTQANVEAATTTAELIFGGGWEDVSFNGQADTANTFADTGIWHASTKKASFRISGRNFKNRLMIGDGGNAALSQNNTYDIKYTWGSNANVQPGGGLLLRRYNGQPSTQNNIVHANGLVYNGDLIELEDTDNNNVFHVHGVTQSGGTGRAVLFANGTTNHARSNLVDYLNGDVHAESSTYGNRVEALNSEASSVTIDPGAQMHYTAIDYVNADLFQTHRYVMSGERFVSAAELECVLERSGSATFNPSSLVDGSGETTTVTVTGAVIGDYADISFTNDLQGITVTAWVSATDTVSIRFQNETGGTVDLASGTLRARTVRPLALHTNAVSLWDAIILVNGSTNAVRVNSMPVEWADGNVTGMRLYFTSDTANTSANFRMQIRGITAAHNGALATPELNESFTVPVTDLANRCNIQEVTFTTALAFTRGDLLTMLIERLGADAADDASGNMFLLGVAILYESAGPNSSGSGPFAIPPPYV